MRQLGLNISKLVFQLCLLSLLLACAPQAAPVGDIPKPVWPAAPLEAKIEWVKEISILDNARDRSGFWGRVREFFIGREVKRFQRPYGVATDYADRLFVADTGASLVHVYDMAKGDYFSIEGTPDVPLQSPIGLAYVGNEVLYMTDSAQGEVLRYNLQTEQLDRLTPFRFQRPTGIAYSWLTKQLFVVDTKAHEVAVLNLAGVEQFRFGSHGNDAGEFNFPTDIWVDLRGQVYVTDALNSRIQMFSVEGGFIDAFGRPGDSAGSFAKPKGVAVDPAGHIYVCDALFDAVQIFSADGRLLMSFGDNGSRPGQFWMPSGIFADRRGFIYVTDTYNRRIQVFRHINCSNNHDCSK